VITDEYIQVTVFTLVKLAAHICDK